MKAEQAKKIADQALTQLSDALKKGKSEELTRYLTTLARFHRYSFSNVMLILSQMPEATQVAGFSTWKKLGRHVKKGEHGIVIVAPMVIAQADASDTAEQQPILRFRGVHVFDVSQTEGEELPDLTSVSGDPRIVQERLQTFVAELGINVSYEPLPDGTDGVSRGGAIAIREGLSAPEEFSVLVHELAHELLHRGSDRPADRSVRETEAEAVSFVVCQAAGLTTGSAASDYIQLYDGSAETLAHSLDRIQRTATRIIAAIGHQEEQAQAA